MWAVSGCWAKSSGTRGSQRSWRWAMEGLQTCLGSPIPPCIVFSGWDKHYKNAGCLNKQTMQIPLLIPGHPKQESSEPAHKQIPHAHSQVSWLKCAKWLAGSLPGWPARRPRGVLPSSLKQTFRSKEQRETRQWKGASHPPCRGQPISVERVILLQDNKRYITPFVLQCCSLQSPWPNANPFL